MLSNVPLKTIVILDKICYQLGSSLQQILILVCWMKAPERENRLALLLNSSSFKEALRFALGVDAPEKM